jgi:hypothetical protein
MRFLKRILQLLSEHFERNQDIPPLGMDDVEDEENWRAWRAEQKAIAAAKKAPPSGAGL